MKRKTSLERSFDAVSFREQPQNEKNLKKDQTLVDPVFKNPGIYHCRISENDCEKQEKQFWSRIGPSGESF